MNDTHPSSSDTPTSRIKTGRGLILVIDDSEIILAATEQSLMEGGFQVVTSTNPLMAASELRTKQPQLLLLDVEMPGLSGPQVVDTLRRCDCLQGTKVVLYSSRPESELVALANACGASGSIPKNVRGPALAQRVAGFLDERPTTRGLFLGRRAVVVAQSGPLERAVTDQLEAAGVVVEARGAIGLDRTLRQQTFDFAFLDPAAFPAGLADRLDRLHARGMVASTAVIVLGAPTAGADAHLDPSSLAAGSVTTALRAARKALGERTS